MVFENLKVRHKKFGIGVVVAKEGKYMVIAFEDCRKNFVYPDAFEKFLTLEDGTVSEEILADLAAANSIKAELEEQKQKERIYSMTHGIVIPGKEMAPDGEDDESPLKNVENEEI